LRAVRLSIRPDTRSFIRSSHQRAFTNDPKRSSRTAARGVADNEHWDIVDAMFAKYEKLQPGEKKRIVGAAVPYGRMARPDEIGWDRHVNLAPAERESKGSALVQAAVAARQF
jgi:hypothetical protein